MSITRLAATVAAASILASVAIAGTEVDRIQCGEWNVRVGESMKDVKIKCGGAEMEKDGNWYYHRDDNKIVVLHFDGDKISKITEKKTSQKGADQ